MKKVLIIALILVVLGAILFAVGFAAKGFRIPSTFGDFHTESVTAEASFSEIQIKGSYHLLQVVRSEDGTCRAEFDASDKITTTVEVADGVLTVQQKDLRKWYEFLGWSGNRGDLTLFLPEKDYTKLTVDSGSGSVELKTPYAFGEVNIEVGSGKISAQGLTAESLKTYIGSGSGTLSGVTVNGAFTATLSSGSMNLTGVRAASLSTKISSGKLTMTETVVAQNAEMHISSGSVILDGFDAATMDVHISSGSLRGTLLTAKNFDTHASSGSIEVPPSDSSAGLCKIQVSSGSAKLEIKE